MLSNYFKLNEKYIITLIIILILIISDQITKIKISSFMINNSFKEINITSFLNLVFVRNTGISFGLLNDGGFFQRWLLTFFAIAVGIILSIIGMITDRILFRFSLVFISSGAIGNAIDRFYFGGVIDFIDFYAYNIHWPAFNLADSFIFIGMIFLILDSFYNKKV